MCAGFQGLLQLKGYPMFFVLSQDLAIQSNVEEELRVFMNDLGSSNDWQCPRNKFIITQSVSTLGSLK
jgi:hypothetical protein